MKTDILCGALRVFDTDVPVYCKPQTGECYYFDTESQEERLVFEVSIALPIPTQLEEAVEDMKCRHAVGILYSEDATVVIVNSHDVRKYDKSSETMELYNINVYGG